MSRPLKGPVPLATVLAVRVPHSVAADWRSAAAERGLGMSDWLRESIDPDAVRVTGKAQTKPTKRRYSSADPALVAALNRAGNNINQVARVLNRQVLAGERVDVLRCLRVLTQLQQEVTVIAVPSSPDKRRAAWR